MAAFVDTNVLIYAFAESSGGNLEKVAIARSLLTSLFSRNELIVSAQVLSEFSANALNKTKPPLAINKVAERVLELSTQPSSQLMRPSSSLRLRVRIRAASVNGTP